MVREYSPSNVPASDQPLRHFISASAVTSAPSGDGRAPLTEKDDEPGSDWNVGEMLRAVLLSCAQAARPRSVSRPSATTNDLSVRRPSSLRTLVEVCAAKLSANVLEPDTAVSAYPGR